MPRRLPIPVRQRLAALYAQRERAEADRERAEADLASYVLAVCEMAGIPYERWVGFDDASGAVILLPEPEPSEVQSEPLG